MRSDADEVSLTRFGISKPRQLQCVAIPNMISDWQNDTVYFSDLLPGRHPGLWSRLVAVLNTTGVPHRLIKATRDIWVRDFMPVQVTAADLVLFRYEPDYLRNHRHLATPEEARIVVPLGARLRCSDINLDGGNAVTGGDKVIVTDKVYKENPGWSRDQLRAELSEVLYAKVVIIPREPYDVIGHADGVVRFVEDGLVVVNDYREVAPSYGERLETTLTRQGLAVERLPHFRTDQKHDGIWSAVGNYCNFLRIGGLVIVPSFGVPQDDLACRTLERLLPGAGVVPLRCEGLAREGGILNCVAWTLRTQDHEQTGTNSLWMRPSRG